MLFSVDSDQTSKSSMSRHAENAAALLENVGSSQIGGSRFSRGLHFF